jgi:hypothetical protein
VDLNDAIKQGLYIHVPNVEYYYYADSCQKHINAAMSRPDSINVVASY